MKVLDLFSGLGGWSQAFKDRGHEVVTVDIEKRFNPTICKDIMELTSKDFEQYGQFDVILASPPCNCFSIASVYRHWNKDGTSKSEEEIKSIRLVLHTICLIQSLRPKFWIMENPTGMLRKIIGLPHYNIAQCQYGRSVMKPTDLWGRLPSSFIAKKCRAGNTDHEKATRSSKNGIQGILSSLDKGMSVSERAMIPYGLSLVVCKSCENELEQNSEVVQ